MSTDFYTKYKKMVTVTDMLTAGSLLLRMSAKKCILYMSIKMYYFKYYLN